MKKYLLLLFSIIFSQTQWTQVDIPDNQNMVKLIPDGSGLYGATSSASIYYSLDNGLNWEAIPMHPDIFPYGVDLFEKVDDYLFFSQNIGGSTYNYRAFYNGEYWEDWENLPYDESIIYEFVHYGNTIYALLNQGLSVSYDYGTSWEFIETPEISGYIHLQYVNDEYLYINHGCNLYRYNIETHEWSDITGILDDIGPPEPYNCTSISQIDKFADKLIISMYWYGGVGTLFYSETNGDSWEIISSFPSISSSGYDHNNVSAMTTQSGTLYAGTASFHDGIFYTQNLIDWTEYSVGLSSYNLSVSDLAVTEEKIYKLGGTVNLFQNELIETGCTDPEACNYNTEAIEDDGSCEYEFDCAGTCGGYLEPDCCGVCGGDNSQCSNCCGMPFPDDCSGVCCSEVCYDDYCGVCDDIPENDCVQDCGGTWGGNALLDNCGICDSDPANDCGYECGSWGGDAFLDECGVCYGYGPEEHHDCDGICLVELDCTGNCCVLGEEGCYWQETGPCGEEGPSNGMDSCGVCGGDNTSCADCLGVPCSNAYMDNCGVCDDIPDNDCVQDCTGTWGGNLEWDCAGICGGDNSTYDNCCGIPPNEDCSDVCIMDEMGVCCIVEDIDECGICSGDNSCLCDEPFIYIEGHCLHQDDIAVLQQMIDNSLTSGFVIEDCDPNDPWCASPNLYMDQSWHDVLIDGVNYQFSNNNGEVEPLELGLQDWVDGRLISWMCGSYIYCQLSGQIPENISDLTEIEVLRLEVNYFSGAIPESVCELENIYFSNDLDFNFSYNMLCPPYPECVDEGAVQYMDTSECEPEYDLGDINGDGEINVIDIVLTVGLILEDSYDAVGDVNEDGLLNVIDVVMLVNWVLNGSGCSDGSSWDYDMDGICDADDDDDDNDGALDPADSDDNNEYVCSDIDGDNCDDCSSGTFDPANDGIDMNGNGICDEGEANIDSDGDGVIDDEDSDPYNQYQCSDLDGDTCDDCSTGTFNPSDDGYDYDGDGQCDDGDCDDDNDGCQECWDYCP